MNWSDSYIPLAIATVFLAMGLTLVILGRRKPSGAVPPPPRPPATMTVHVKFYFYLAAGMYCVAVGHAAQHGWPLLIGAAGVIPLILAIRSRPKRVPAAKG